MPEVEHKQLKYILCQMDQSQHHALLYLSLIQKKMLMKWHLVLLKKYKKYCIIVSSYTTITKTIYAEVDRETITKL